ETRSDVVSTATAKATKRARPMRRLADQVEAELGRRAAELFERARLELADAFARDAELLADLLQCLRVGARETEAALDHVTEARLERRHRPRELRGLQPLRGRRLRLPHRLVLDQVGVEAVAVADGCLQAD